MDDHRQHHGEPRRQRHGRAGHADAVGIAEQERPERAGDDVPQLRACPFLLAQEVMCFGQRAEPALELGPLVTAGAAEGLHRDRLHQRQRVLDAMIELLDQEIVQHLAARDRGGHPHGEGEANQQQDAADQARDCDVAPERRDQRALGDARHDRPAGQLRSGKGGRQRDAIERNGRKRGLRRAGHRIVECAGSLLAERLGRVGCTREHASLGVQQRHRPLIVRPLLLDQFLEYRDRRTEGERVGDLAIAQHRNFHSHDRPFLGRTDEQVGILRRLACKHPLDDLQIVARWQIRRVRRDGRKELVAGSVGQQKNAVPAILADETDCQPTEAVEITALQGIAEREHLQAARHPLHFRIEHHAHASHRLEHPACRLGAILAIVGIGKPDGKDHQRQHRSRDEESEPDRKGEL